MQLSTPSFPKLAVILSLVGLVAGLGVSMLVAPRYESTATMQLSPALAGPSKSGPALTERVVGMEQEVLSRSNLKAIIQDPRLDLYGRERVHQPLEYVIEKMRTQDIGIRIMPPGNDRVVFQIRFSYSDPKKARGTVQALVLRFSDANAETAAQGERSEFELEQLKARVAILEKRLGIASSSSSEFEAFALTHAGENLDVLDAPSKPANPVSPNRAQFAAIGFGGGFSLAVVIAVFRRRPPPVPLPAQTT